MSALKEQIGGSHYKQMKIQPAEYCFANNIGKLEGDAIAYLSRWKMKNGLEDLRKAKHTIELLIELEVNSRNEMVKTTLQGNDLSGKIETELHWDEHHERRIDLIGQNGGDGLHYQPKFGPPLWSDFSAERGDDEESQV